MAFQAQEMDIQTPLDGISSMFVKGSQDNQEGREFCLWRMTKEVGISLTEKRDGLERYVIVVYKIVGPEKVNGSFWKHGNAG